MGIERGRGWVMGGTGGEGIGWGGGEVRIN